MMLKIDNESSSTVTLSDVIIDSKADVGDVAYTVIINTVTSSQAKITCDIYHMIDMIAIPLPTTAQL